MRRLISIALFALISAGAHAATHVLEPQDVFHMRWAADPQIRKDGAMIAYARTANDIMKDRLSRSIWLIDTATGAQTPLATGPGDYSSPRWSPDGSRIAYLATGPDGRTQIAIHWLRGETASITNLTEAPSDITWSPDGRQIAFVMLAPEPGPAIGKPLVKPAGAHWGGAPTVIDSMNFRADGQGLEKPGFKHIYVLSMDGGGAPRQLTSGPFSDAGPLAWSPDGRSVYFAGNRNPDWKREPQDWARHTAMTLSIYRLNVADGTLLQLSHDVGPYHAPTVSPDGKLVAFLGYHDKHIGNQNVRLNVMNADGSNLRVIGESLDRSLHDCQWAADGHSLYVQYDDQGITKVGRMGLNGHLEPVASDLALIAAATQLPYSGGEFTVSGKGTVAYSGGTADDLPEVYLVRDGKAQRLTDLNSEFLKEVTLGKLSALPVKSSVDGRSIGAWELLPPNFDPAKKYPLILEIHGGPYASYGPVFAADYELYAAAGYIVVYGNPRGSTSYGEEFANLIYNNYPSHDYDDLMSIVDAAIQKGGVDTDNLFVTGSSGGGVLTAWTVGKTHRFKAAVVQRPVINWTSWLLTSDMSVFGARYWFKQLPWEDQATYWQHSPLALVGNVTTPTMVVVGLSDLRTTVGEAEQYYQALQLRHVPTELYEIPGEPHPLMRPSHLAVQTTAILEWFGRYRTAAGH
ncbi:MAG TPA: S9 family peptidase [Steroidobacteraceae bacterium]|jgi:dipeptidyl aminopeptidase/acylaminoacyl peptidase|nr:S9 family peptidase [Steroidobacteraceae bacterium]